MNEAELKELSADLFTARVTDASTYSEAERRARAEFDHFFEGNSYEIVHVGGINSETRRQNWSVYFEAVRK